jgi:hypothetical protein
MKIPMQSLLRALLRGEGAQRADEVPLVQRVRTVSQTAAWLNCNFKNAHTAGASAALNPWVMTGPLKPEFLSSEKKCR